MERVDSNSSVESLFTSSLDNVLVGANSSGFEGFGRQLLVLVGNEMAAEGEVVDRGLLSSEIVDSDLGVGDTTVVSRLGEPKCKQAVFTSRVERYRANVSIR